MLISSAPAHTTTWSPAEADIKCKTKIRLKTKAKDWHLDKTMNICNESNDICDGDPEASRVKIGEHF